MISKKCEIADHENCHVQLYDKEQHQSQCECSCHAGAVSSKDLEIEKEKQGITRTEELRAETVP
jgi:hypothetical protein